jgi:hypothetical protein
MSTEKKERNIISSSPSPSPVPPYPDPQTPSIRSFFSFSKTKNSFLSPRVVCKLNSVPAELFVFFSRVGVCVIDVQMLSCFGVRSRSVGRASHDTFTTEFDVSVEVAPAL